MSRWVLKQFVPDSKRVAGDGFGLSSPSNRRGALAIVGAMRQTGICFRLGTVGRHDAQARARQAVALVIRWSAGAGFALAAFRRITEVLLGVAVLLLSGLCLLTTMALPAGRGIAEPMALPRCWHRRGLRPLSSTALARHGATRGWSAFGWRASLLCGGRPLRVGSRRGRQRWHGHLAKWRVESPQHLIAISSAPGVV